MKRRKDYLTLVIILLIIISCGAGIMSINFTKAYDFVNQYGHTVKMYGYGIYAHDTYFQAPISIGTDFCILFLVVPMLFAAHRNYVKCGDEISELKLISVYGTVIYYAASMAFGITYNRLFLVYMGIFSCSLFGMFKHIINLKLTKLFTPTKGVNIFFVIAGIALVVAWLPDIIPTLINGGTLSLIGVYTTSITYVLDMGILCPACFAIICLLKKQNPVGTVMLAIMLKLCIVVGALMIPQAILQIMSGCDIPVAALITKSLSFVVLSGFAFYFNKKMYKELGV